MPPWHILALSLIGMNAAAATTPPHCQSTEERFRHCVTSSQLDPAVQQYDYPHWVSYARSGRTPPARLLLFMSGTGGRPPGPAHFLEAAIRTGYRVISLAYNNEPSIAVYCPRVPDPACSGDFRRMRSFGDTMLADTSIQNSRSESIQARLVALLRHLHGRYPEDGWNAYLDGDTPRWAQMTLAGQSQGAGMAAYIAKQHPVARVIMFSSPWDFYRDAQGRRQLAPWLAQASQTPAERWFGVYHAKEAASAQLAAAYAMLNVPPAQIYRLEGALPEESRPQGQNPYHGQGIGNPDYTSAWTQLLRP